MLKSTDTQAFTQELKALIEKYEGVELQADFGYYGDLDGLQVCIGEKVVASFNCGDWRFGDEAIV